ncbi:MAG: DUF2092 domain-containing protein [Pseudomonadota bacterium]|nr:DUF2092 domain-containing protein [Pseudomonadota bacterium]
MTHQATRHAIVIAAFLGSSGMAVAEEQAAPAKAELNDAEERMIALAALNNMGSYLRSLESFKVQAVTSTDEVLTSGQKIQFDKSVEIQAKKPAGLRADVTSPYGQRSFYYDGKAFTLHTPEEKFYATIPVSGSNGEFIEKVQNKTGASLPLADLFYWGAGDAAGDEIESAIIVGYGKVNGVQCEHYAFRQKEVDWQICIQEGETPLPLKLVITSKQEEEQPQHVSVLKWDTTTAPDEKAFTYAPQEGDTKISFIPVGEKSAAAPKGDKK